MGKNLLLIILLFGICSAWYVPVAYPAFPAPVQNRTSSIFCELQSNQSETINMTAAIQYANGTNITVGTLNNTATNTKASVFTSNFSTLPVGTNMTVFCSFSTGDSDTSGVQTVLATNFGSNSSDALIASALIGLGIFSLIFSYLHVHAKNETWGEAWFLIMGLLASFLMLAIMEFAQDEGANGVEVVALALFIGTFWAFFLGLVVFGLNLMLNSLKLLRDTVRKYY